MSRKPRPSYLRLVGSDDFAPDTNVELPELAVTDPPRTYREGRWHAVLIRRFLPNRYRLQYDGGSSMVFDAWEGRYVFRGWGLGMQDQAEKYANRRNFCWRLDLAFYWSNYE